MTTHVIEVRGGQTSIWVARSSASALRRWCCHILGHAQCCLSAPM